MTTTTTTMRFHSSSVCSTAGRSTPLLLLMSIFVLTAVAASDNGTVDYNSDTTADRLQTSLRSTDSPTTVFSSTKYQSIKSIYREFLLNVDAQRENTSASIMDFQFDTSRIRMLSDTVPKENKGIVYWMNRDQRVEDNWAFLYAQKLAIQNEVPLHIVFYRPSIVVDVSFRQYMFTFQGLKKVEVDCRKLNIPFHLLIGDSIEVLSDFARKHMIGTIVVDFSPLRDDKNKIEQLVGSIGYEVPVIQVDAHNIVPCWITANYELTVPTIIRQRMSEVLDAYLTEFPPVIKHPYTANPKPRRIDWQISMTNVQLDRNISAVPYLKAGYVAAMSALDYFIKYRLGKYRSNRVNPLADGLSNMSPWLHFGHISAQRVLLEVMKLKKTFSKGASLYKEEVLIRRELSENYCNYNSKYDSIEGGPSWGRDTIDAHRNDTRLYVYTREQFENSQTRDKLWNAANNEMIAFGKTHRYLRPYWAKKILEFSKTPEEALATAHYLNNKFSLDGNDPNGYAGMLWAMTGLHDIHFKERSIYGTVRYIDYYKICKTFDYLKYIRRYVRRN